MKEHRFIAFIKDLTQQSRIGDDCATLPGQTLVSADMLVENLHFRLDSTCLGDLGWKAMAVNLSDIAAMAGRPRYALVNLSLPAAIANHGFEELYKGMQDCAQHYRTKIVGGDLTGGEKLVISITVIGEVHEAGCMFRSGASPGDYVVVTGDFGASAAGLWLLSRGRKDSSYCLERHRQPRPRLCESWSFVRAAKGRGALMDASDGLADALLQIAAQSGVAIDIDAQQIPVHEQTKQTCSLANLPLLQTALYGGEDYELVGTISPDNWQQLCSASHNSFKIIGKVSAGALVRVNCGDRYLTLDLESTFAHFG